MLISEQVLKVFIGDTDVPILRSVWNMNGFLVLNEVTDVRMVVSICLNGIDALTKRAIKSL